MTQALEGIRVLEMALQYPGPYCSVILSELGAEIVKLERPDKGDSARRRPAFFHHLNTGKKSIALNLKTSEGQEVFHRLVKEYDVITEGFRPGVASRLGADYETLSAVNPRLVYCSISGYGQSGPYRDLPGHDLNYMAVSGMLNCFQDKNGDPVMPGAAMADLSGGMFAAIGIMAALAAREKTGRGQYVDVALTDGLLSWMGANLSLFADSDRPEKKRDPGYGLFYTKDGKRLALGIAHEDWFWERLCRVLGLEDMAGIPVLERHDRRDELVRPLKKAFVRKNLDEWLALLTKMDIPATRVNTLEEVFSDPHVKTGDKVEKVEMPGGGKSARVRFPVRFSQSRNRVCKADAPALGEHTGEILRKLGYSEKDILQLRQDRVI